MSSGNVHMLTLQQHAMAAVSIEVQPSSPWRCSAAAAPTCCSGLCCHCRCVCAFDHSVVMLPAPPPGPVPSRPLAWRVEGAFQVPQVALKWGTTRGHWQYGCGFLGCLGGRLSWRVQGSTRQGSGITCNAGTMPFASLLLPESAVSLPLSFVHFLSFSNGHGGQNSTVSSDSALCCAPANAWWLGPFGCSVGLQ